MPQSLFYEMKVTLKDKGTFKQGLLDAKGKQGIHPRINIIAVLHVLENGSLFDQVEEVCKISQSTTKKLVLSLCALLEKYPRTSIYVV